MYDVSKPPSPLPSPQLTQLSPGTHLLKPLSRRGRGPGIVLLTPDYAEQLSITDGVPSPILKWAEEGYVVAEIQASALKDAGSAATISRAIEAMAACEDLTSSAAIGLVAYDPESWILAASFVSRLPQIVAAVIYCTVGDTADLASTITSPPLLRHLAGRLPDAELPRRSSDGLSQYAYPAAGSGFAMPFQPSFDYNAEGLSHTRSLDFLKRRMGGPYFDLEAIWDEHTYYEFVARSVEHTMSTMVAEPYVNHVPTLTGGIGRDSLTKFYRDIFIPNNAADSELEVVSRTVGVNRVVDEFIFKMTHDVRVDWLLPGIPPTGRKLQLPFTAIVNFRGDRLYHEHVLWDQGSALRQLGLLPEYLPFPYGLPDGSASSPETELVCQVPVLGAETAHKLRDRNCVKSNELVGGRVLSRGQGEEG